MGSHAEVGQCVWKDCLSLLNCLPERLKMRKLFAVELTRLNGLYESSLKLVRRDIPFPLQVFRQRFILFELPCRQHSPFSACHPIVLAERIISTWFLHTADLLLMLPHNIAPSLSATSVFFALRSPDVSWIVTG